MNYIYLFLVFTIFTPSIYGMKGLLLRPQKIQLNRTGLISLRANKQSEYAQYLKNVFVTRNREILDPVIDFITREFDSLESIAHMLTSFSRVNKTYNLYCNNNQRTLTWIKNLSHRFDVSNMHVSKKLGTFQAKKRYALQYGFYAPFDPLYLDTLKKKGFDLEFTDQIVDEKKSYLMQVTSFRHDEHLEKMKWLIANGAHINDLIHTLHNIGVVIHYGIDSCDITLIEKIVNHPQFNANICSEDGSNLLHKLVGGIECKNKYWTKCIESQYQIAYQIMAMLLSKGTSYIHTNQKGQTPLQYAQTSEPRCAELLEKAIENISIKLQ